MPTLDKRSPIPLYYQLADWIREQIRTGALATDSRLPSERELSEQFGVSRMTVRQAAAYLVQEGWLTVRPGVGTFVAASKFTYDALHLLGFTAEMMQRGDQVTSNVLEQAVVTPPPSVASELQLTETEQTVKIMRVRQVADEPLLLETIYLPATRCPGLERVDLAARSLYAVLEGQYGLQLHHARQTLEASVANEYEIQLFQLQTPVGVLVLEGTTFDTNERPVEYFKAVYRGDRFTFQLNSQHNGRPGRENDGPAIRVVLSANESSARNTPDGGTLDV